MKKVAIVTAGNLESNSFQWNEETYVGRAAPEGGVEITEQGIYVAGGDTTEYNRVSRWKLPSGGRIETADFSLHAFPEGEGFTLELVAKKELNQIQFGSNDGYSVQYGSLNETARFEFVQSVRFFYMVEGRLKVFDLYTAYPQGWDHQDGFLEKVIDAEEFAFPSAMPPADA